MSGKTKQRALTHLWDTRFLAAITLGLATTHAPAITFEQMQDLAGGKLIEQRLDKAFARYGLPQCIQDHTANEKKKEPLKPIQWKQTSFTLGDGNWTVHYGNDKAIPMETCNWRSKNDTPADKEISFKRLSLHTKGRTTTTFIRKYPEKTFIKIPDDPLEAQKITDVEVELKTPITKQNLIETYGLDHKLVNDPNTDQQLIRYWVDHAIGSTPLNLFALEFILDKEGKTTPRYRIRNTGHKDVAAEFAKRVRGWEANAAD